MGYDIFALFDKFQPAEDKVSSGPDRRALFDVASEQHGYFTAEQAAQCGYARDMLTYHVKRGTFQRIHRGIYRFRDFPPSPQGEVAAAWIAVGKDVAVVSHESALDLWDLSDVVPNAVHLTVPRALRSLANRRLAGVVVHTTGRAWNEGDVRRHEGFRLTSPERTILDATEVGTQPEQIERAVAEGLRRGWVDPGQLRERARERGPRTARVIERALVAR